MWARYTRCSRHIAESHNEVQISDSYGRKTKKYISVDVCTKSVGPALWGINNQSLGENTMAAAKKAAKKPAKKAAKKAAKKPAKKKAAAKKK